MSNEQWRWTQASVALVAAAAAALRRAGRAPVPPVTGRAPW